MSPPDMPADDTPGPADPSGIRPEERAAIERLLKVAQGNTGQSRKVADFLLAWWNTGSCGGWDPTDLWAVDVDLARSMLIVLVLVARVRQYPDHYGYRPQFEALVAQWRPHLLEEDTTH